MSIRWELTDKIDIPNNPLIYRIKYSPEGDLLAVATCDGFVHIYSTDTYKLLSSLHVNHGDENSVLAIDFRPLKASGLFQTSMNQDQRILLVSSGFKGVITAWDIITKKAVRTIQENDNEVYALNYRNDGKVFCTAGKDRCVRVYDARTYELKKILNSSNVFSANGHVNRVFTTKFHPIDPNIIISAGWDMNCQIWSISDGGAVRTLYGPYICGESLDIDGIKGKTIVTGSWRPENQLQLWDYKTGDLIKTIPFPDEVKGDRNPKLNVYATSFNPECDTIAVGGSGSKGVKIIDRYDGKLLGKLDGLEKGIYTLDFSPVEGVVACAGGEGIVYLMQKTLELGSREPTPHISTQSDVI